MTAKYRNDIPPGDLITAYISKMNLDEEVDAWGVSRETGLPPLFCAIKLDKMVEDGSLDKRGVWYSLPLPKEVSE